MSDDLLTDDAPLTDAHRAALLCALQWQCDMGIDEAVCHESTNHFQQATQQRQQKHTQETQQTRGAEQRQPPRTRNVETISLQPLPEKAIPSQAALVQQAQELAQKATNLHELRDNLLRFDGCSLRKTAAHTLFGSGPEKPAVMILTGVPHAEEDKSGQAVAGPAATLLNAMLQAIHQTPEQLYITPTLFWRPPGDKKPNNRDVAVCLPFITRQIELVDPQFLFLMGDVTVRALLDSTLTLLKSRGRWHDLKIGGKTIPALTSLSLDHLLNAPRQKALAWDDLKKLRDKIREQ